MTLPPDLPSSASVGSLGGVDFHGFAMATAAKVGFRGISEGWDFLESNPMLNEGFVKRNPRDWGFNKKLSL